jgi:hypothetical protein
VRSWKLILIVVLAIASGVACAKARANAEPILMPELLPPPPPPRVIETVPVEPLPTIAPSPVESALLTPPARTPAPPARPDPPKVDPPPALSERPAPATPALTLKPGPSGQAQTEAFIRAHLERALRDLQRVNYAALNADGRTQFDTARTFIQQAEEALKGANLMFASKLADKAATMAAVLVR